MKKIYRFKILTFILCILFVIMCGIDYYIKKPRALWPIYHWALGFEKIPKFTFQSRFELISCNGGLFDKPVTIREFAEKNNVKWHINSSYKYGLRIAKALRVKKKHHYQSYKKSFEAKFLSELPCDTMKYDLNIIKKNLTTRKEKRLFIKTLEYDRTK